MPRIRSIHPGLFTDEAFVELSEAAQIFYVGILTQCDDFGVFEWKPLQLRMRLRPTKDGAVVDLLEELASVNTVRRFAVDDRHYGAVRNFCQFQRPKKPKSSFPLPTELRTFVALNKRSSEPDDDDEPSLLQKSEIAPQREEIRGRRLEGGDSEADASGATARQKPRKPNRKATFPPNFVLDDACRRYAAERGFGEPEVERMFERFKNHHTSKGSTFVDWMAAWRTWVGNQVEFDKARQPAKSVTWDPGL